MSASPTTVAAAARGSTSRFGAAFWERTWRMNGANTGVFLVIGYLIYGLQPGVGASPDALTAFYAGDRTRILISAFFFGATFLNLAWFAAAIRSILADAGKDGWGAAATASSTAVGVLLIVETAISASLALSIAGSENSALLSSFNDLTWSLLVLSSFPKAMLVMAGTFGFWRAGMLSNRLFGAGVAVVLLGVLSATTWLSGGIWAPDGALQRFIFPAALIAWFLVAQRVVNRAPATRTGW